MKRRLVALTTDIVLDIPAGFESSIPEGQAYLRNEFIDFLQSAEHIQLSYEIGDEVEDEGE